MRRSKFLTRWFFLISLVLIYLQIEDASSLLMTNTMRYGMQEENSMDLIIRNLSPPDNNYKINSHPKGFYRGQLLKDKDQDLLEKFYHKSKNHDTYASEPLMVGDLWNSIETNSVGALSDFDYDAKPSTDSGWSVDADLPAKNRVPIKIAPTDSRNYSPTLRLLTVYNPVEDSNQRGKITGATLFGEGEDGKPSVSSKSAKAAIKLHDDLLMPPPNDGKVRVRMYYHRAIHDDARLYGTGPWKYWGHGWGVEFGYDPKIEDNKRNFYQRGYTIERAFGRDFCKNKANCRKSDPEFFKNPQDVGNYSKQYQAKQRAKTKYSTRTHNM